MSFHASGPRVHTYEPHPVPARARGHAHIASYFIANGEREFTPRTNGRELAEELGRNLRPSARRALFEKEA